MVRRGGGKGEKEDKSEKVRQNEATSGSLKDSWTEVIARMLVSLLLLGRHGAGLDSTTLLSAVFLLTSAESEGRAPGREAVGALTALAALTGWPDTCAGGGGVVLFCAAFTGLVPVALFLEEEGVLSDPPVSRRPPRDVLRGSSRFLGLPPLLLPLLACC